MAYDTNNIFAKILRGEIPCKPVYEDEFALAFPDINPQAPTHILIIPKNHLASHAHATQDDAAVLGRLLHTAGEVASAQNLTNGYRLVINTGPDGGQTVDHLHIHLLGGRQMHWPPG